VPIFHKYEIFVQSVNSVREAPIIDGQRKIGYSTEMYYGIYMYCPVNERKSNFKNALRRFTASIVGPKMEGQQQYSAFHIAG